MDLRCSLFCGFQDSIRGEFFKGYKGQFHLAETFMMIYAIAHRWRPAQVREELKICNKVRVCNAIDAVGAVASFAGSMRFKSEFGTWDLAQAGK